MWFYEFRHENVSKYLTIHRPNFFFSSIQFISYSPISQITNKFASEGFTICTHTTSSTFDLSSDQEKLPRNGRNEALRGSDHKVMAVLLTFTFKLHPPPPRFHPQKMAELNKFTSEHREEAGSDGEGEGPRDPALAAAGSEPSGSELIVQQIRTVDRDGNLKVVYPSKTDLCSDVGNLTVVW